MNIWIITVGEPLPKLSGRSRLWRTGLLAEELVKRDHTVTWWTSRVDHLRKEFFAVPGSTLQVGPRLTLELLDGRLYRRNVSIARLMNHWQVGRAFRRRSRNAPSPDVILCSFPTIELSVSAASFGRSRGIPVVIDVRDLWPDVFLQAFPPVLHSGVRLALRPYYLATRRAFGCATAVMGISERYLEWGLACAGRQRGYLDRTFPLGYSLPKEMLADRRGETEMLRRHGVKRDSVSCVFAGTLGRTYDLAPVFEAASIFAAEPQSPFHFMICGDGERAAEWRRIAANLPNVTFTGWLEQGDMRAALVGSDIGLAAYAKDAPQGLPNKVIEYLAAGLPVVSSLTGETAAMLLQNDCGRTYEAGNSTSLRQILLELVDCPTRKRLSYNARRKFEADFQAETVYRDLASFLEEMAHTSDCSPGTR